MVNYLELLRWHNKKKCPYPKCKKVFDEPLVSTKVENGKIKSLDGAREIYKIVIALHNELIKGQL